MTLNAIRIILAATCLISPAIARDAASDSDTRTVSIRGLDLSKPEGIRALDRKIGRAIADVCDGGSVADAERERSMLACRHDVHAQVSTERASAIAMAHLPVEAEMLAVRTR